MKPKIVTIGVHGFDEATFFNALLDAGVNVFCDIRARRGMRGAKYAFANSVRLQDQLRELDIRYIHAKDLAPTQAVRERQKAADKALSVAKRARTALSPEFIAAYQETCLAQFDAAAFIASLGPEARVIALFCAEREPEACHRSLVAQRLHEQLVLEVEHITP